MNNGESEEAAVGIESDGRRKEIADETTQVAEINKKYKSQQKVETFFVYKNKRLMIQAFYYDTYSDNSFNADCTLFFVISIALSKSLFKIAS